MEELIATSLAIQLRYSATEECGFSECHDSQSPQDQAGQGAFPLEQGEMASLAASFMEVRLPHGARARTPRAPCKPVPGATALLDVAAHVWFMLAQLRQPGPLTETCLSSKAKQKGNKHGESKKCKQLGFWTAGCSLCPFHSVLSKEAGSRPMATGSCQPVSSGGSPALTDMHGGA